jgi:hypothetical protein
MVKFNMNERKKLKFDIRVSGVHAKDLKGSFKLMIEGVEYGFPINIYDGDVVVEVPPLSTILSKEYSDGTFFESKLEIIANDTYLVPWQDKVEISNPLKVEAVLTDIQEIEELVVPAISIKALLEETVDEEVIEKEEKKQKIKSKFAKKMRGE